MKRRATAVLSALLLVVLAAITPATAATATSQDGSTVTYGGTTQSTNGPTVTYGGTTQSTDPTRYDYVEPVSAGQIAPMSASGYGQTSPFQYTWQGITIMIPTGTIYHQVVGSGLQIRSESADWTFLGILGVQICNYQWQFQNRLGEGAGATIYSTRSSPLFSGCLYGATPTYTDSGIHTVRVGQQCARLFVNGSYRGEQCHSVYP